MRPRGFEWELIRWELDGQSWLIRLELGDQSWLINWELGREE